jgi:hypothetical protein
MVCALAGAPWLDPDGPTHAVITKRFLLIPTWAAAWGGAPAPYPWLKFRRNQACPRMSTLPADEITSIPSTWAVYAPRMPPKGRARFRP